MRHWTYRVAEYSASHIPKTLAYGLVALSVDVTLRVAPSRFSGLRDNLHQVLPNLTPTQLEKRVRSNARNLGRSWVDVMRLSRKAPIKMIFYGEENLIAAIAKGKGVVVPAVHLGPWDAGLAGYETRGSRVVVVAEKMPSEAINARIVRTRARHGITVLPIDAAALRAAEVGKARAMGAATIRAVIRELRENSLVALAIDRDITGTGTPTQFFGASAPISRAAVEIAIHSGAAIVPIYAVRRGKNLVATALTEIEYSQTANRQTEVNRVVEIVLDRLEGVIFDNADQWHMTTPLWQKESKSG